MSTSKGAYALYGLTVDSSLALPCPRVVPTQSPSVYLRRGTAARFTRACREAGIAEEPDDWFHYRRLADDATYLRWNGLFEFLISKDGRRILYRRFPNAVDESFHMYLLGQVLSFSLIATGTEPLHGTVVQIDDAAVAFLGNCGFGKSTLGAAFLARGFSVVTDDLMAVERRQDKWYVHPGLPRIKLFPIVARRLLQRGVKGTPMNNGTTKLIVPLEPDQAVSKTVPLRAVYVLSTPRPPAPFNREPRVQISSLSGPEAFLEVVRGSFNLLVLGRERHSSQFRFATHFTATMPIRRLMYRRSLSLLPAVCDAVLADLKSGFSAADLERVS